MRSGIFHWPGDAANRGAYSYLQYAFCKEGAVPIIGFLEGHQLKQFSEMKGKDMDFSLCRQRLIRQPIAFFAPYAQAQLDFATSQPGQKPERGVMPTKIF